MFNSNKLINYNMTIDTNNAFITNVNLITYAKYKISIDKNIYIN